MVGVLGGGLALLPLPPVDDQDFVVAVVLDAPDTDDAHERFRLRADGLVRKVDFQRLCRVGACQQCREFRRQRWRLSWCACSFSSLTSVFVQVCSDLRRATGPPPGITISSGRPVKNSVSARAIRLFFLAGFHAYVVLSLACLHGIIFRAGLLLIPTLFAGVSWFSPCCSSDAAKTEQHEDDGSDNWHDDLLSLSVWQPLLSRSCTCQIGH
jgi:hypothetical protein